MHFLLRKDRSSEPMMLSMAVQSDEEALKAALDYAQNNEASFNRAVVAIDGRACLLRNYQLPVQGKRQLDQVVAFELEDDLPLGAQDLVTDHSRGCFADNISFVSAAAVPKMRIAELVALFEEQGVDIEVVDVDVAAFARACASRFADYERCVGLEIGSDRTLFCSLVKGKVRKISIIPWGESLLIDGLAKENGMSAEEVDRLMVLGEDGAEGDEVRERFDKHLKKYLQKTMREVYRLLGDSEWPSRFIVSGEIVRALGFREKFEAVSDGGLDVWEERCLKLGDEVDEGQRGSGLAVGYGTAEDSGVSFNFRKGEFSFAGDSGPWTREIAYLSALLLSIVMAWGAYSYISFVSGEREIAYLNEAMVQVYKDALPKVSQELAPMQYQSILSSRVDMLTGSDKNSSNGEGASVIKTLHTISSVLNKKIDVEFLSLSLDDKRIDVQGETKTMNEVDSVRAALDKAKVFKAVKVKNAIAEKRTKRIRFEIEVQR